MPRPASRERNDEMLTPREARWVAGYLRTGSKKAASEAADYANPTNLLDRPRVRRVVAARMEKIMDDAGPTAERVVAELGKIAFANLDDFTDDEYRITEKPDRRAMAAVRSVTSEVYYEGKGDDAVPVKKTSITLCDKLGALNALGRHFGLFKDKLEISGDLSERLDRAYDKMREGGEV